MEPMLPSDPESELADAALELVAKSSALAGRVHGQVRDAIGDLVRSMNCYYSNLIEGHDTHPRDIERALADRYSKEPRRRELQLEARAHIDLQRAIDTGEDPDIAPTSSCLRAMVAWGVLQPVTRGAAESRESRHRRANPNRSRGAPHQRGDGRSPCSAEAPTNCRRSSFASRRHTHRSGCPEFIASSPSRRPTIACSGFTPSSTATGALHD